MLVRLIKTFLISSNEKQKSYMYLYMQVFLCTGKPFSTRSVFL